jgi:hypothetical protein
LYLHREKEREKEREREREREREKEEEHFGGRQCCVGLVSIITALFLPFLIINH